MSKPLQQERMRQFFIDAAKQIIETEGASELSARKVAKIAGYSYATIYNYFTDLDHLMWWVSLEYLREITELLEAYNQEVGPQLGCGGLLQGTYRAYVTYYLENPGVYEFIFFRQLGDPPDELREILETPSLFDRLVNTLHKGAQEGLFPAGEIPVLASIVTAMVHGLLSLYFSSKRQLSREMLLEQVEANLDYLLMRNGGGRPC